MTVQRGVIASYASCMASELFRPYQGDVYVIDAITNNPGGPAALTTPRRACSVDRQGAENGLSDTWINYAVPIQAWQTLSPRA